MEAIDNGDTLVRLTGVHMHYQTGLTSVHALRGVDLALRPGDMVVVGAPSGHGKTTLLNLLGMLEYASEGRVALAGHDVTRLPERVRAPLRARLISFVFQSPNLIPILNAQENVMLPLLLHARLERPQLKAARQRATELLAQVGLATQATHYPARLDPGQRQRVAIARAVMTRPRLVLADEPAARLDHAGLHMMQELFAACRREQRTAFVIASRDPLQLSGARTLQLVDGRLSGALAGTPRTCSQAPL